MSDQNRCYDVGFVNLKMAHYYVAEASDLCHRMPYIADKTSFRNDDVDSLDSVFRYRSIFVLRDPSVDLPRFSSASFNSLLSIVAGCAHDRWLVSDCNEYEYTNTNTFISGKNPYTIGTYIRTSK